MQNKNAPARQVRLALLAVIALLGGCAPPPVSPPNLGKTIVRESEKVVRKTLPNGLRVIIVRDPLAEVVTTVMNYQVGSDDEAITGLAHAQEHMMFRGSQSLSASQFAEIAAITGGRFNADTQNKITQYFFVMPSQYLDIALNLEASRATGLLDSPPLWEEERKAIEQEVTRDNSDADYRLYVKMLGRLMAGTPYANPGLGTLHSFEKQIGAPQLKDFFNTWYHPNNATYVIAGDVDPVETLEKIEKVFGKIPAGKLPARQEVHLGPLQPEVFEDQSDESYTTAYVGYRFPGYQDADYAASQILADALNSQRGKLYELVASGQAFSASFQIKPFSQAGIAMAQVAVPTSTRPQEAVAKIKAVIEHYRNSGIPDDLIEAAKRRELAEAEFQRNSIQGLALQWSQAVAVEGRHSPDDDIRAIQGVTPADVNRVLRYYLDNHTATVAYAVPRNSGPVSTSATAAKSGGPEQNVIIPTEHAPLPGWAAKPLENLRAPQRKTRPVEMTLSNGIRLVVQTERITPTVVVAGLIKNNPGMQTPPGKEGIAAVTSELLSYGTTTYDRLQYQAEIDRIAASVDTGMSFSLSVLSKDFDRGVQLLADGELHPAFAPRDFRIVKAKAYQAALDREKAPDHLAQVALSKALYPPGDPERRFSTPRSIGRLTLKDVKDWHLHAYRPDLTTIVVVGDITPEQAKTSFERWFGAWSAVGPTPEVYPPPVGANRTASLFVPAASRVQDQVLLAENLGLVRADPDRAPMEVANAVLGEGFYASLLFHDLREINGYVYTVSSNLNIEKTRSLFAIAYGAMPENVGKAQALAVTDLQRLQRENLPDSRLQRAKALLIGKLVLKRQSYDGIARQLLGYASEDLPLDQDLIDARAQMEVTPEKLRDAMAKWLRPDGFVRLTVGPRPQ